LKLNRNKNQKKFAAALLPILGLAVFVFTDFNRNNPRPLKSQIPDSPEVLGQTIERTRGSEIDFQVLKPNIKHLIKINFDAVSAKAFAVVDEHSNTVLFEKNPHEKLPIASLTKLMTSLLAFERLDSNAFITASKKDTFNVSPSLYFSAGEEIKILNLLEAVLVCSANDAARALANAVSRQSKQNFTSLMNERAKELELIETNFSNPLGFDSNDNYSSVSDLLKLTNFTQSLAVFKNLGKRTEVGFVSKFEKNFECKATNKLLGKDLEIESIKTGYTENARGSIIARVKRGQISLLIIVVGSEDREQDLLKLSELSFENFDWK